MNNERANLCIYFCVKGRKKKRRKKSHRQLCINPRPALSDGVDVMDDALIPQRQHRDKHVTTPILFFLYSVYYAERGTQKKKKRSSKK